MDEIKQFKEKNGSITYSNKELIGAIHVKLDRIEKRLLNGEKNFSTIFSTINIHKKLLWAIYSALGGLLILVLKINGVI